MIIIIIRFDIKVMFFISSEMMVNYFVFMIFLYGWKVFFVGEYLIFLGGGFVMMGILLFGENLWGIVVGIDIVLFIKLFWKRKDFLLIWVVEVFGRKLFVEVFERDGVVFGMKLLLFLLLDLEVVIVGKGDVFDLVIFEELLLILGVIVFGFCGKLWCFCFFLF